MANNLLNFVIAALVNADGHAVPACNGNLVFPTAYQYTRQQVGTIVVLLSGLEKIRNTRTHDSRTDTG